MVRPALHPSLLLLVCAMASVCLSLTGCRKTDKGPADTPPATAKDRESAPDAGGGPGLAAKDNPEPANKEPAGTTGVELKTVTLDEFKKAIAQTKKIVVMDIWADWCIPCKEKFPHYVELAKKYQDNKQVEFWSVSLDDAKSKDRALKFLQKQQATFPNYLLHVDGPEAWQDYFDMNGPPAAFVYDSSGQRVGHFVVDPTAEKQYTYDDVNDQIQKLLKK
jgi:thiol-disulfide isomerase/thioredoxin